MRSPRAASLSPPEGWRTANTEVVERYYRLRNSYHSLEDTSKYKDYADTRDDQHRNPRNA
jgi:hypothetical protein